ncbi:PepSY-associated TM helix domain-containing protein [Shewanella sp.]|uniref:PepSY-associated TM helix domain-containing protein n=1 Tax=Shewanella sp. TaxID=50422 RepID=UPI004053B31A
MKDTFFRSMTWLHTWVGLLVCWVLLIIFYAGSLSYFRHDISIWTAPELHQGVLQQQTPQNLKPQLDKVQQLLQQKAANADSWFISLPSSRHPYLSYGWQDAAKEPRRRGTFTEEILSADNQTVITDKRSSRGGDFFYRLHFDLHYLPVIAARWLVGLCSLFMLLALLSGIVIHKRIFKDFFSFRANKGPRSWLDGHNVTAVLALPYHLMITYTGLVTFMMMFMPWGIMTAFDGKDSNEKVRAFRSQAASEQVHTFDPINLGSEDVNSAQLVRQQVDQVYVLSQLLPSIERHLAHKPIKQIVISQPQSPDAKVNVYPDLAKEVTDKRIPWVLNPFTGELISKPFDQVSGSKATHDTFMALHTARFSEPVLRIIFFICGLMGCAMIATGTVLWAVKIRQKQAKNIAQGHKASLGLRLVEGLNLTFIAGLPLGTAAFFYANRLLAPQLDGRAQLEVDSFFIGLGVVGLCALISTGLQMWRTVLAFTALAFAMLPLLNGLTSSQHLFDNIATGQWVLVGFDLMSLIFALALSFAAIKCHNKATEKAAKSTRNRTVIHMNTQVMPSTHSTIDTDIKTASQGGQ